MRFGPVRTLGFFSKLKGAAVPCQTPVQSTTLSQYGNLQVDRYKQLLLKQRDIMIALTGRLNERDEQILTLQEELEAYDAHQK